MCGFRNRLELSVILFAYRDVYLSAHCGLRKQVIKNLNLILNHQVRLSDSFIPNLWMHVYYSVADLEIFIGERGAPTD